MAEEMPITVGQVIIILLVAALVIFALLSIVGAKPAYNLCRLFKGAIFDGLSWLSVFNVGRETYLSTCKDYGV
jgi:hypothetical protein